jgi:hypothetical protein
MAAFFMSSCFGDTPSTGQDASTQSSNFGNHRGAPVTPSTLSYVFRALPMELVAGCVLGAMGLRWKPICDKIRKHSYAIEHGQYLMPPLEYPVFEPVYWPEYGKVCYVVSYVLEKGGRRRRRTYR